MQIVAETGRDDIAKVYLAEMAPGRHVEFVHSLQPPFPRSEKWVLIISTLYGCPVGCNICDAGGWYKGKLTTEEMFQQIDHMVTAFYPDRTVPVKKFKIQFARMGEPALNPNVLEVLKKLPHRYRAPGLLPSVSTVAPNGTDNFFEELIEIKNRYYSGGNFQMQFSIHTTDPVKRAEMIPVKKWEFDRIAAYGNRFYKKGDRKVALNFALAEDSPLSAEALFEHFDPAVFLIKVTPVNPTINVIQRKIVNAVKGDGGADEPEAVRALRDHGYDVIVSIGELEENKIGSNCGQYVKTFLEGRYTFDRETYQYPVVS